MNSRIDIATPVVLIAILSVFDGLLTQLILSPALELNPVLSWAWRVSPALFFITKSSLTVVGCWLLYRLHATRAAWACTVFMAGAVGTLLLMAARP